MSIQLPPANWYPDPSGVERQRWWDGEMWTDQYTNTSTTRQQPESLSLENGPESTRDRLPAHRSANAFVVDFSDSALVHALVRSYSTTHGGTWVGGTATLTDGVVAFRTNSMNRAFTGRRADFTAQITDIQDIAIEKALVTNIIALRTSSGLLQIRCYRAAAFAEAIAVASRAAGGRGGRALEVRQLSGGLVTAELLDILRALT